MIFEQAHLNTASIPSEPAKKNGSNSNDWPGVECYTFVIRIPTAHLISIWAILLPIKMPFSKYHSKI